MARPSTTDPAAPPVPATPESDEARPAWWEDWQALRDLISAGRVPEARLLVKELADRWPDAPPIQHYARVLEPAVARTGSRSTGRAMEKDYAWIREHAREYPGCW